MGWQPSGQHVGEGEREQREHITRLWGACSCQPQPCRKARVGSAGETQSLVLARLRRAGSCPPWMLCRMCKAGWQREGRCPLQGTPHLRWISWVQTSTATHYPEERRTEQNPMFVQWRGRLRALKLARKGGELHGTASITSSSGTLFLYASLAGQRNQLWHRSPGIPCHHLHISTKIWFSFFHIHLLRDSETGGMAVWYARYPTPQAAFWGCNLPVCPLTPSSILPCLLPSTLLMQTCSLQPQHGQSTSLHGSCQQHEQSVPSLAGSLWQLSYTNTRDPTSPQALMSCSMSGMIPSQHPALASLLPWATRSQPFPHTNTPRGQRHRWSAIRACKSRQLHKAWVLSRLGKRQLMPAVSDIKVGAYPLNAKPP